MKGLLLKDFYNLRTEYLTYTVLLILTAGFMIITSSGYNSLAYSFRFLPFYFGFAVTGLTQNTFFYDEKCGYMKYALTTPVSRKTYIMEKYIFHLLQSTAGMLLGIVFVFLLAVIFTHTLTVEYMVKTAAIAGGCFIGIIILGTWQVGLSVKFGAAKARTLFSVMIIGLLLLASFGSGFGLFLFEEGIPPIAVVFAAVLLSFTIWMFCMSFVWMRKKEF